MVYKTEVGVGTVVGSVVFNIFVGVGFACYYAPSGLKEVFPP